VKFEDFIYKGESFVKSMLFDCHSCGQCVLSKNGLICPMSCPKGLRNGPCGGTINGMCEVHKDKKCVHCRIHKRVSKGSTDLPVLQRSPDHNLHRTSSYLNLVKGIDRDARVPLPYMPYEGEKKSLPVRTSSELERKLKSGLKVLTCEIRSPRTATAKKYLLEAEEVRGHFDAFNVTAFLNGKPSIPSTDTAETLNKLGMETIVQSTCRDHTRTSFISDLLKCQRAGLNNMLCLTGDHYIGSPGIKQSFDMDSAAMIYEANHLARENEILFTGDRVKESPDLFLGGAVNPFTRPVNIPIRRLKQKCAAGADFIQSQLIFDLPMFKEFWNLYLEENLHRELFFIPGIPVVISRKASEMIRDIPGVLLPDHAARRFADCSDIRKEGLDFACELIDELIQLEGVSGFHMMLFGTDHSVLPELSKYVRDLTLSQSGLLPGKTIKGDKR